MILSSIPNSDASRTWAPSTTGLIKGANRQFLILLGNRAYLVRRLSEFNPDQLVQDK